MTHHLFEVAHVGEVIDATDHGVPDQCRMWAAGHGGRACSQVGRHLGWKARSP